MRNLIVAIRSSAVLWVLTAFVYPIVILVIGQVGFPDQANGSLITNSQQQIIGSALIGQTFTSERYFGSRPSAVNYSEGEGAYPTGLSGASNLAPSNPQLLERLKPDMEHWQNAGIKPTSDLVYSSGSGLDPHISVAAAQAQVNRIAQARKLSVDQLQTLIEQHTDRRFLGIFGEPGVNVLQLNFALDQR
jgi:K+-transporting ATPase ATPase C chain